MKNGISETRSIQKSIGPNRARKTIKRVLQSYELYLFMLPALIIIFSFSYIPMYGLQIAFKDYIPQLTITGSPWIGFDHFERFFNSYQIRSLLSNTVILSAYGIIAGFPFPIMIALVLNQLKHARYRSTVQTVIYMPHFISLVVMVGMISLFFSPNTGIYGSVMRLLGEDPKNLLGSASAFRHMYVWSDIWQHAGWDSIIYIAAISAVDPSLYEAATIDGAGKFQKMRHIDLPTILPTIVTLLILRIGNVMTIGFEKVLLFQNAQNSMTSEIISTYVYKVGIQNLQYGYSAAVSLFNNLINFVLLIFVNQLSKKVTETSLW